MRAQKRDENEPDIIAAFAAQGCSVEQLPGGNGRPDLLVRDPKSLTLFLVEVKMPGKKLNPLQRKWHKEFGGPIHMTYDVVDVSLILAFYRRKHGPKT